MAYKKQTWVDFVTPLDAEHMNHIEDGIGSLSEEIAELKEGKKEATYNPELPGYLKTDGKFGDTSETSYSRHTDYIPLRGYSHIIAKAHLVKTGYALAFFDENKTLLPDISIVGIDGVNAPNEINMPVPSEAAYCMLSNYHGSNGAYTGYITLYPDASVLDSVSYTPEIAGGLKTDGSFSSTTYTYHTDYIPLAGYARIIAKAHITANHYALAFFNSTKTLLPDISIVGAGVVDANEINMAVPAEAAYCMLSNYAGEGGGYTAFITLYIEGSEMTSNPLFGRKIAFLGDSITTTGYGKPNYWQLIEEKTGCSALNYGKSASRLATVEGDNVESFLTRAAAMDTSADAVLVMGGTNDCNLKTLLGEWDSEDETTFYGALNALISLLRTNFPGKPIIFCTPIKRKYDTDNGFPDTMADLKAASATEQITMQHCVLAIKAKCARHGIPVIDLADHSGFSSLTPEYYYSESDNLHPSALGYVRIANMVQAELEKQFTHTVE